MSRTALIAVGGNSLIRVGERGTIEEQLANAHQTSRKITQLVADGWRVVITHGNGPQVGAALLRSERAAGEAYTQPLDVCVANTQSEIGYMLERGLQCELRRAGFYMPVMTILTQVRVSPDDPALTNPTKPIGPFYTQKVAEGKIKQHGWTMVEDAARGYRRVVASQRPCSFPIRRLQPEFSQITVWSCLLPQVCRFGAHFAFSPDSSCCTV